VNQGTGNSSINATLDPASLDCFPYNVSSPLTVTLSGKANGTGSSHDNGSGKSTYLGTSYKYNFQNDFFNETFTGTNGFATGTFDGSVYTVHRTQLQKQ